MKPHIVIGVPIGSALRAFIGPLADDIPSIFPIVAGVLLLIATMWYANSVLVTKTSYLELRKAAIDLSYTLLDKGLLGENLDEANRTFNTKCEVAKPQAALRGVAFALVVKRFCGPIKLTTDIVELFNPDTRVETKELDGWICSHPITGKKLELIDALPGVVNRTTFVALNYPLAVPCPELKGGVERGLGLLTVVVWAAK